MTDEVLGEGEGVSGKYKKDIYVMGVELEKPIPLLTNIDDKSGAHLRGVKWGMISLEICALHRNGLSWVLLAIR